MNAMRPVLRSISRPVVHDVLRPEGKKLPPVLSGFSNLLDQDPQTISLTSDQTGTLTWDFDTSAVVPDPGTGDIATGTATVTAGANSVAVDLSAHPGRTGYLHLRLANANGTSNVLTSQEFTTPTAAVIERQPDGAATVISVPPAPTVIRNQDGTVTVVAA